MSADEPITPPRSDAFSDDESLADEHSALFDRSSARTGSDDDLSCKLSSTDDRDWLDQVLATDSTPVPSDSSDPFEGDRGRPRTANRPDATCRTTCDQPPPSPDDIKKLEQAKEMTEWLMLGAGAVALGGAAVEKWAPHPAARLAGAGVEVVFAGIGIALGGTSRALAEKQKSAQGALEARSRCLCPPNATLRVLP
jgi:hypothetical protein